MGLRHESVHAKQESATKDRHAVVEALAQAGGSNGDRAVGKPPYHDGVYNTHAHPPNLGED